MTKGIRAARKEARPREILEAAFEEFVLRGYAATNVEHIAERVGVTKGTIYVYFSSKEVVFEQMVMELAQPKLDLPSYHEILHSRPAIDAMLCLLRDLYTVIVDDYYTREILRFLIAESYAFGELRQRSRDTFAVPLLSAIAKIIRFGCEHGQFRAEAADVDPHVLISPILGLNVLQHVFPEMTSSRTHFMEQHLAIVKHLLVKPVVPDADATQDPI